MNKYVLIMFKKQNREVEFIRKDRFDLFLFLYRLIKYRSPHTFNSKQNWMEERKMKKHSKIKREVIDRKLRDKYKKRKSKENSQNIKFSRYIEHLELTDISLNKGATNRGISLEEQVISNLESERIIKEIWKLPTP